jgi:hypothetical protein
MLPAAVAGGSDGQLAIGYFRTVNGVTDPNSTQGKWTYSTAESSNAAAAKPTFSYSDVSPGTVYHNGDICNQGILCGSQPGGPSDRSLLDFTSAATDSHGCPVFTFAGNPTGSPGNNTSTNTFNFVTRQTNGCLTPSGSAGPQPRPGCPLATGRVHGKWLGRVKLGMTRAQARRAYRQSSDRGRRYEDFFCLTPRGVRVGYASPKLLRTLPRRMRHRVRGRVIWISSANRLYAIRSIRAGASLRRARRVLHLGRAFHVGRNDWYFARNGSTEALLKVRHGRVREVGIVMKSLARNRRQQSHLVRSFY